MLFDIESAHIINRDIAQNPDALNIKNVDTLLRIYKTYIITVNKQTLVLRIINLNVSHTIVKVKKRSYVLTNLLIINRKLQL